MTTIQKSSMSLPDPTFTSADTENITPLDFKTEFEAKMPQLSNKDTFRYVLYSEPNWDIFIYDKIVAAGFTQYSTGKYDGYCLYWLVKFANLAADQDQIGFELAIPGTGSDKVEQDRTGFKFVYDATLKNYTTYSYYINNTVAAKPVTTNTAKWLCQVTSNPNNNEQVARCYNYLPEENTEGYTGDEYRFTSDSKSQLWAWTNISTVKNLETTWTLNTQTLTEKDKLLFKSAIFAGFHLSGLVLAIATLHF